MDNTNDKIFFNFSYFALKLLGKGLYSNPWTAIAELVANGLDAKATCVRIFIDMSDKKNSEIEIFDNGTGMTYSDLAEKYEIADMVTLKASDETDTTEDNDAEGADAEAADSEEAAE